MRAGRRAVAITVPVPHTHALRHCAQHLRQLREHLEAAAPRVGIRSGVTVSPLPRPAVCDGRIHAMKTTLDGAGRLVIPKEIRREARLAPGVALEVRWREGRIEIEPAPAPVRLQRRGRLLVAVPKKKMPKLAPKPWSRPAQDLSTTASPMNDARYSNLLSRHELHRRCRLFLARTSHPGGC